MIALYSPPPTKLRREYSVRSSIATVDYLGIVILLLGAICIVTSLTWGGNQYSWNDAHVVALLVVGVVSLVVFGCYGRSSRMPLY